MKKGINNMLLFLCVSMIPLCSCTQKIALDKLIEEQMALAIEQYSRMAESIKEEKLLLPRTIDAEGKVKMVKSNDWTSGFYPGVLWYLYEYSNDEQWKNLAMDATARLEKEQYNTQTHDLGFMLYCSYGNGFRLTHDSNYATIMLRGANSLCTRYNPVVGLIRSWDHGSWQYPVIIDNMMNLEYLCWASTYSGDTSFYHTAVVHANNTLRHHFRSDNSSYHVVDFNPITGDVISKGTHQGYDDESAWARGQAWGFYGYTMMYRETKKEEYLQQAIKIADFIIHHPNLPADKVPYWDYNDPKIPDAPRDASAAAIFCSGLIELSGYVGAEQKKNYLNIAEQILRSLSSENYCAKAGENGNFILKHSVGSKPHNNEVDVPLNYADYYYIEAMLRMNALLHE